MPDDKVEVKWDKLAEKNSRLPRTEIYGILRHQYLKKSAARSRDLAALLECTPQVCSTYATGTDNRTPPWWTILRMCQMLNCEVVVSPSGVRIIGSTDE